VTRVPSITYGENKVEIGLEPPGSVISNSLGSSPVVVFLKSSLPSPDTHVHFFVCQVGGPTPQFLKISEWHKTIVDDLWFCVLQASEIRTPQQTNSSPFFHVFIDVIRGGKSVGRLVSRMIYAAPPSMSMLNTRTPYSPASSLLIAYKVSSNRTIRRFLTISTFKACDCQSWKQSWYVHHHP
jgi:hypothetical protein